MLLQNLIVAVLVLASALYAVWSLLPGGAKRALALRAQRWPLPAWAVRWLQRATKPVSGCGGCGGCEGASAPRLASAPQTVHFHRRRG